MTAQPVEQPVPLEPAVPRRAPSLSTLIALERTAFKATSLEQLAFVAVNETHRLIDYYQCLLWRCNPAGKVRIQSISGVSEIDHHAQAAQSLQRLLKAIHKNCPDPALSPITRDIVASKMQQVWDEWLPAHGLWCPFARPGGEVHAGLLITRDAAFTDAEIELLVPVVETYAYVWNALDTGRKRAYSGLVRVLRKRTAQVVLVALLLVILALPIR